MGLTDYGILTNGIGAQGQALGQAGNLMAQQSQGQAGGQGQVMGGLSNWLPEQRPLPTTKLEKIFYDAETERLNSFWGITNSNQIGQIIAYSGKLPQYYVP